jgi:dTDP-4-dehydrorhamnose reductase
VERLLVTGVDFPLGGNLALKLADRCEVVGLYCRRQVESPAVRTAECDSASRPERRRLLLDFQPHWIIHCGPLALGAWDEPANELECQREGDMVTHWAELAAELSAQLTVVSSDVVLAGPRMFHDESAEPQSVHARAAATRIMERRLERSGALVVRTHAYGWCPVSEHAGFAERAFQQLTAGKRTAYDGLRYATPILATDLAELLLRAYEKRLHGLYHLSGAERTNPYRFVQELASSLGFHAPEMGEAPPPRVSVAEPCQETSLDSMRARRMLEMATPMLREGLNRFAEQAHNGWRERWRVHDQSPRVAA